MANWQAGAAFSNSFLNTIQGLTALQNAQMQNSRMQQQMQREQEYETAVSEETQKAKGLDLGNVVGQLKFQDITGDDGAITTAADQRQGLQQALPTLQQMSPAQQQEYLTALSQTEVGQGLGLENLKPYQTAGGETKFNQLGREALGSDVNRAVRQRMLETGNIHGQEQALRMGKLTREDEEAQQKMDFSNWMMDQTKQIQTDPTKWVETNLTGYNKAGKGSFLNDGMTGKVIMSADGKTSSFVQTDKKGKVVASTPITVETAMQGLQAMAFDKYKALPGNYKEAFTMGIEQEKLGETKRHNRAVEGIYNARNAQGGAGAAKANYVPLTGGYSFNTKTGKYVDIDGNTVTDPKVITDLNKLGQKADIKSLGEGLVQVGNQVYQQDAKTGEWVSAKGLPGSTPDKYASALGGKDIDTSRPGTQPAPAAAPQQAVPVARPDLSKWSMKPAGKTLFGETDYVLEGPSGRMSLSDFIDRYGYNPTAEFVGRR